MKAVVETATGLALYLFSNAEAVTITATGLYVNGREHATDIRPETHSIVTAPKPTFWRGAQITWDGASWSYSADALDAYKAERIAEVAQRKWEVETGGLTVEGVVIDTTRESQSMITGAYNFALLNQSTPDWTIDFRASTGWITLTASEMIGIGAAVAAHVQASFTRYRALEESITACTTVAEVAAIDINIGWPG